MPWIYKDVVRADYFIVNKELEYGTNTFLTEELGTVGSAGTNTFEVLGKNIN